MLKKNIYLLLLSFIIILPGNVLTRSRRNWKDYWKYKRHSKTSDDPMDRLIFKLPTGHIMEGFIFDAKSSYHIPRAQVLVYDNEDKLISTHLSDNRGEFLFAVKNKKFYKVKIKHRGYAVWIKPVSGAGKSSLLSCALLRTKYGNMNNENSYTYIQDRKLARLSVPASILKRLDNKPIRFPVKIELRYLDPRYDLNSMPGRDMLSIGKKGLMPLISYGAVIIEARDALGGRVVINRKKEKKTGLTTSLTMRLPWIKQRNIQKKDRDFLGWQINPGKANWGKVQVKMEAEPFEGYGEQRDVRRWSDSIKIKSIELAPFNLDKPKPALAIMLKIKRTGNIGKFFAVIKGKSGDGRFQVCSFFNTFNWAAMKFLFPAGLKAKLLIYTSNKLKYPVVRKWFNFSGSIEKYKFDKKKQIITIDGKRPNWKLAGKIQFK